MLESKPESTNENRVTIKVGRNNMASPLAQEVNAVSKLVTSVSSHQLPPLSEAYLQGVKARCDLATSNLSTLRERQSKLEQQKSLLLHGTTEARDFGGLGAMTGLAFGAMGGALLGAELVKGIGIVLSVSVSTGMLVAGVTGGYLLGHWLMSPSNRTAGLKYVEDELFDVKHEIYGEQLNQGSFCVGRSNGN